MLFSWLRTRRRRKLLADPFPHWWTGHLTRNVAHHALLPEPLQARLRDAARVIIAEKRWHGREGLFVTEEMKVTIAAQAALLLLGGDHGYFRPVKDIVVFPTEFRTPVQADGWEDDRLSEVPLAGRAVDRGPVLLAWDEVLREGRNPAGGQNVVVHEFAHQLDFDEWISVDGPDLGDAALEARWRPAFTTHFERHERDVAAGLGNPLFTPHAADDEYEFFANASESFYCRPALLRRRCPELYQLLAAYYRVDPVAWSGAGR
jgi:Mlc titration factor MtfA (ptsG expression regulator)